MVKYRSDVSERAREIALKAQEKLIRVERRITGIDRRRVAEYLAGDGPKKLQIGAGYNLRPGWLNTNWFGGDLKGNAILMDATVAFPLPDNSFDYVYSEHVIEHLPEPGGASLLRESYRVLKPGGKIRISTPDINFLFRLMEPELPELEKRYVRSSGLITHGASEPTPLSVVNRFVRDWGHQFIYDPEALEASMRAAGFESVAAFKVSQSDDPEFRNLENVDRMENGFLQLETMTLQGHKPRIG